MSCAPIGYYLDCVAARHQHPSNGPQGPPSQSNRVAFVAQPVDPTGAEIEENRPAAKPGGAPAPERLDYGYRP